VVAAGEVIAVTCGRAAAHPLFFFFWPSLVFQTTLGPLPLPAFGPRTRDNPPRGDEFLGSRSSFRLITVGFLLSPSPPFLYKDLLTPMHAGVLFEKTSLIGLFFLRTPPFEPFPSRRGGSRRFLPILSILRFTVPFFCFFLSVFLPDSSSPRRGFFLRFLPFTRFSCVGVFICAFSPFYPSPFPFRAFFRLFASATVDLSAFPVLKFSRVLCLICAH